MTRRAYPTQDGRRAAEIDFSNVRIEPENVLGPPEGGLPTIERAIDETIAALSAEAVGAMSEALAMTVEYLKTRKQFGVTIGSFQALQHRASDMVVALEQARSMMFLATMSAAEENASERAKAISAAKVQIGRSSKFIGAAGRPDARRDCDDLRIQGWPSVQASDHDRRGATATPTCMSAGSAIEARCLPEHDELARDSRHRLRAIRGRDRQRVMGGGSAESRVGAAAWPSLRLASCRAPTGLVFPNSSKRLRG